MTATLIGLEWNVRCVSDKLSWVGMGKARRMGRFKQLRLGVSLTIKHSWPLKMPINYNCQIYHRVRLKQIRFKFKVVKHFINQMKPFCHFAKPWRWDGDETICEMNQKEEKRSQLSSIILSRPFWNKKSHYTAGCSNFVAWIRSRKILKWNSPKGAWSITSFSFLQHIFYN